MISLKLLKCRKATARSLCHRRRMTVWCPFDLWDLQRHRGATLRAPYDYRKSLRSFLGQDDNLKPCVVLTITVRCPYVDRTMLLRCVYGLRAYDFSNLSLCGVKQNRRGHDARKSVRWSQGLPAETTHKTVIWTLYGHRILVVRQMYCLGYICYGRCTIFCLRFSLRFFQRRRGL